MPRFGPGTNWSEHSISRTKAADQIESQEIDVTILVQDAPPDIAYESAVPPLPRIGALYPYTFQEFPLLKAAWGREIYPRLQRTRSDWAPVPGPSGQSTRSSFVHLIYTFGPHIIPGTGGRSGKRRVQWETDISTEQVTVQYDLDGKEIPDGANVPVAIETITATLLGGRRLPVMKSFAGRVNDATFFTYGKGEVIYDGARCELIYGTDVREPESANVVLHFRGKVGGWQMEQELGEGETGPPVQYRVLEEASFDSLFADFDMGDVPAGISGGRR